MSEQSIGNEPANKCGHYACKCMAKPGEQFCSEVCAKAAAAKGGEQNPRCGCPCGHPGCD